MTASQTRPQTAGLELHVLYVPEELWNSKLNTVSSDVISQFISAGFIRASPDMRLRELRERLGEFLWEDVLADTFLFLKCVGRSLAVVKRKQEKELKLKSFAPPYAPQPELYLLPGVDHVDSIPALSPHPQLDNVLTPDSQTYLPVVTDTRLHPSDSQHSQRSHTGFPEIQLYNAVPSEAQVYETPVRDIVVPDIHLLGSVTSNAKRHEAPVRDKQNNSVFPELQLQKEGSINSPQTPVGFNAAMKAKVHSPIPDENHKKTLIDEKAFKWTGNEVESVPVVTKTIHEEEKHMKKKERKDLLHARKDEVLIEHVSENRGERKHARKPVGRNSTRDSGIPESLADRDMDYAQNRKRQEKEGRTQPVTSDHSKIHDDQLYGKDTNILPSPDQYVGPPTPPLLALSTTKIQVPTSQTEREEFIEQLKQMKKERTHLEKTREDLVKKAKGLLEQNKLKRNHARDAWKKKYFETKKMTAFLEEKVNKLRQELELYYQKLLTQLEARDIRERSKHPTLALKSKNTLIIQVTSKQQEIDQLRRKLDNTKMRLVVEIKMRRQAASDLRALRAELAQKKIQSSLSSNPSISVI
ncbi:spermatogenesis-associated protein 1 [Lissotriton helveticus]